MTEEMKMPNPDKPFRVDNIPDWLNATFLKQLWQDVHRHGLDSTIMIHGRKRTGKSTLGLKILELFVLYPLYLKMKPEEFTDEWYTQVIKDHVFWSVKDLSRAMVKVQIAGNVLILDEAGVDASNLRWWNDTVQNLRDIMHVDGFRHMVLIIILPKKMHFAKGTRDMINMEIKTRKIDKVSRRTYFTVRHVGLIDNPAKDSGVFERSGRNRIVINTICPPNEKLITAYRKLEDAAKEKIIREKVEDINKETEQTKIEDFDPLSLVMEIKNDAIKRKRYIRTRTKSGIEYLEISLIQKDYNLNERKSRMVSATFRSLLTPLEPADRYVGNRGGKANKEANQLKCNSVDNQEKKEEAKGGTG